MCLKQTDFLCLVVNRKRLTILRGDLVWFDWVSMTLFAFLSLESCLLLTTEHINHQ